MRCLCSVGQHDSRSRHSTNHATNINAEWVIIAIDYRSWTAKWRISIKLWPHILCGTPIITTSSASARTAINCYKHKRTMRCSCSADQHDSRSIHSTNQPTNTNAESSSPLIVLYLDTKIAHEGERDCNFKHSCRQQAINANVLRADCVAQHHVRPFQPYIHWTNEQTNKRRYKRGVIDIHCSVFGQQKNSA